MNLHDMTFNKKYTKSIAYFSMEFAIHQALKIYSGGLGFLSGSHMRSAYDLKQNIIGVGILWSYGYYDQMRNPDRTLKADFIKKFYYFLEDLGIVTQVNIHGVDVNIKVYHLPSSVFGCAPLLLLSTDIPENDFLSRTITQKLYDANEQTRISQEIILGVGGVKVLEALEQKIDIYHMNEGHALPLVYKLYEKYQSLETLRKHVRFTTHTPEDAGNEEHSLELLHRFGFFSSLSIETIREITGTHSDTFNLTLGALRAAQCSNAVSKMHAEVANKMWSNFEGTSNIIALTNAQSQHFWMDKPLLKTLSYKTLTPLIERKKHLKRQLFDIVADQTGKMFKDNVLTLVWARRFAEYKRPGLIKKDFERFKKMLNNTKYPVQIIWAGKPYPFDSHAVNLFNELIDIGCHVHNVAVLIGYELDLSRALKYGADVWLNTPRISREASGTSGMSAAMNGAIHFSTNDGWHPEFARHGSNAYTITELDHSLSHEEQDTLDNKNMMDILENEIIPTYYKKPKVWANMMRNAMQEITPQFDSLRMADEYYMKLYN